MDMNNFDWVSARHECSVNKVFQLIRLGVESDVEKMNSLRGDQRRFKFDTVVMNDSVTAFLDNGRSACVKFNKSANGMTVTDVSDKVILEATLTLNDKGECRLKINGQEREFWQFRKMALEPLFFEVGL